MQQSKETSAGAADLLRAEEAPVLVVDDEESLREVVSEVLREEGHRVLTAASAEEALTLLDAQHCDLVITDIRMPGMSGIDLLQKIKERDANTQVIIITSHASFDTALTALRTGAYDYLIKPFEDLELISTVVNRALEKVRLARENKMLLEAMRRYNEELEEVNGVLRELAIRDGLTGLYNHRYFQEMLAMEAARAQRHQRAFSLLFIDVDHFKKYNDTYGHPLGDRVLCQLGEILKSRLRKSDMAARYGGEEFVLLLPETDEDGAMIVAENIRREIAQHPFPGRDACSNQAVTVSIGVAAFPRDGISAAGLLHKADQALYAAKYAGRNRTTRASALDSAA